LQKDWKQDIAISCNFPLNLTFEDTRYGYTKSVTNVKTHYNVEQDSKYIISTNPGSDVKYKIPKNYKKISFISEEFNSVEIFKLENNK